MSYKNIYEQVPQPVLLENVPKFNSFWEKLFVLKIAPNIRGLGIDSSEFCVPKSVGRSLQKVREIKNYYLDIF